MAGPGWPRTLLIWTYDEHGGYYDHVPPPPAEPPDEVKGHSLLTTANALRWILRRFGFWRRLEKIDTGPSTYDRYGFRVPAVIVSPFSKPNFVYSRTAAGEASTNASLRFRSASWQPQCRSVEPTPRRW